MQLGRLFKKLHVGFSGLVTHGKNEHLRTAAFEVPLGRLLLESDTPHAPPSQVQSLHTAMATPVKGHGRCLDRRSQPGVQKFYFRSSRV